MKNPCRTYAELGACLLCYSNARKRSNYKGHYGYTKPRRSKVLKPWEYREMKKRVMEDGFGATGMPATGDLFCGHPSLFAYLTDDFWDDGSPRKRATIMLFADGATWKAWFNDREEGRTCWMTGDSPESLIAALDLALETDTVSWKSEGGKGSRGRK